MSVRAVSIQKVNKDGSMLKNSARKGDRLYIPARR